MNWTKKELLSQRNISRIPEPNDEWYESIYSSNPAVSIELLVNNLKSSDYDDSVENIDLLLNPDSGVIVDVGCGNGFNTIQLAHKHPNHRFLGIDNNDDALEKAVYLLENAKNKGVNLDNVSFEHGSAYELSAVMGSIVAIGTLHHLDIKKALKRFYDALPEGGVLYLDDINSTAKYSLFRLENPHDDLYSPLTDNPAPTAKYLYCLPDSHNLENGFALNSVYLHRRKNSDDKHVKFALQESEKVFKAWKANGSSESKANEFVFEYLQHISFLNSILAAYSVDDVKEELINAGFSKVKIGVMKQEVGDFNMAAHLFFTGYAIK